jgi:hypothetical protein
MSGKNVSQEEIEEGEGGGQIVQNKMRKQNVQ